MALLHKNQMKNLLWLTTIGLTIACNTKQDSTPPPPPEIPVVAVVQKDVPIYLEQVGQIFGLKDIPIRARVDGFLEEISFREGEPVLKGQVLYRIDANPFLADVAANESKVSEAETRLTNAKNELNRYKPLAEINAVSQSDLDAAQANYDAATASLKAANANLQASRINLGYCTLQSPINGIIGKTEARVGEYVGRSPNPLILNTVSKIDTVRVQFSISESTYLRFAKQMSKEREEAEAAGKTYQTKESGKVELILADNTVYEESGVIDFVNNQIDASTGSLLIQASFLNPKKILRPGLYAKVRVQQNIEKNALVIPQRCVMEIQGQYSVFVVNDRNTIEQRSIQIGHKIGDLWLVTSGLTASEIIVIDALQKVGSGMVVSPKLTDFVSKVNSK